MFNAFALFRSLVIYGVCLPLAIILGYLVANPEDMTNDTIVLVVLGVLMIPIFLKWHHPFLILVWNMNALLFFLPGHPTFWLPAALTSFTISLLNYIVNRKQGFLPAPTITLPLLLLVGVVWLTARLTGGIGLRSAGGESFGGRRYITLFAAAIGFYAVIARPIPLDKAATYLKMYFLGAMPAIIGSLAGFLPSAFYIILMVFPSDSIQLLSVTQDFGNPNSSILRLGGLSVAGPAVFVTMIAIYGIRGIFEPTKFWRIIIFSLSLGLSFFGGFRSSLIFAMFVFGAQFYYEGLMRSRLLPIIVVGVFVVSAFTLPFANKLPLSVQRTISFLPVDIDPNTRLDAQGSIEWRVGMWERVIQEVPKYLLVGKGYAIDPAAMEMSVRMNRGQDPYEGSLLAGDYHNGPLSVIVPFGIWGAITFLWFLWACFKVFYQHYKFGPPEIKHLNTLLLSYFVAKVIFFFTIFGSLYSDMPTFTGLIGLSIAMNGGVLVRAEKPAETPEFNRLKLITIMR